MAGLTRLELATSCVTGRHSNQLNYNPVVKYVYRLPLQVMQFHRSRKLNRFSVTIDSTPINCAVLESNQ